MSDDTPENLQGPQISPQERCLSALADRKAQRIASGRNKPGDFNMVDFANNLMRGPVRR